MLSMKITCAYLSLGQSAWFHIQVFYFNIFPLYKLANVELTLRSCMAQDLERLVTGI